MSHEQSVHIQVSCIRELWTVSPMTSKTGLTFSQLNLRLSIAVPFGVFRLGSSEGMNPEWWEISAIFSNSRVSKHQPWNHVTNKNTKWVCLKIGYQRLPHFHPLFHHHFPHISDSETSSILDSGHAKSCDLETIVLSWKISKDLSFNLQNESWQILS